MGSFAEDGQGPVNITIMMLSGTLCQTPTRSRYPERFRWPLGNDPGRVEGLREEARYLYKHTQYAIIGCVTGVSMFEVCWFLRGYENALLDWS